MRSCPDSCEFKTRYGWCGLSACIRQKPSTKLQFVYVSDVVPVVRCRDCKYSDVIYETTSDTMPLKCLNIRYGGVLPDWYCEHGERRETKT